MAMNMILQIYVQHTPAPNAEGTLAKRLQVGGTSHSMINSLLKFCLLEMTGKIYLW